MVTVQCDTCGDDIDKWPSQVNDNNFCDSDCYGKYRETLTGEDSNVYKNATTEYECEVCGEAFERPDAWVDDDRPARTCSNECKSSLFRQERSEVTVGLNTDGYLAVQTGNEQVGLHRLLAVVVYGFDEVAEHDHVHHPAAVPWLNLQTNVLPVDRDQHAFLHRDS